MDCYFTFAEGEEIWSLASEKDVELNLNACDSSMHVRMRPRAGAHPALAVLNYTWRAGLWFQRYQHKTSNTTQLKAQKSYLFYIMYFVVSYFETFTSLSVKKYIFKENKTQNKCKKEGSTMLECIYKARSSYWKTVENSYTTCWIRFFPSRDFYWHCWMLKLCCQWEEVFLLQLWGCPSALTQT